MTYYQLHPHPLIRPFFLKKIAVALINGACSCSKLDPNCNLEFVRASETGKISTSVIYTSNMCDNWMPFKMRARSNDHNCVRYGEIRLNIRPAPMIGIAAYTYIANICREELSHQDGSGSLKWEHNL